MSLENVKEGDFVFFSSQHEKKKAVVQRATKTRITVEGRKFNRGGWRIGGSRFDSASIDVWDETKHSAIVATKGAELESAIICRSLDSLRWRGANLSLEQLRQVKALLESFGVSV